MLDHPNNQTFKELQDLISKKMNLVNEAMKMPMSGQSNLGRSSISFGGGQRTTPEQQKKAEEENSRLRREWEAKNPDEAKVYAERERLASEASTSKKQAWEKQQGERKQWWSNPQNERKAIEWEAKNPRPQNPGYSLIQWEKERENAGILPREEKEFRDIGAIGSSSKPWQPKPINLNPKYYGQSSIGSNSASSGTVSSNIIGK